jgi:hypothetical protein
MAQHGMMTACTTAITRQRESKKTAKNGGKEKSS